MSHEHVTLVPIKSPSSGGTMAHYANLAGADGATVVNPNPFGTSGRLGEARDRQTALLNAVAEAQTSSQSQGRIFLPLSARLLEQESSAAAIVEILEAWDPSQRAKLVAEVHGFPPDPPLEAVEEVTVPLLSYFEVYTVALDLAGHDTTVFANCNYKAVTVNLAAVEKPEVAVRRASVLASARRLKLFIWNVDDDATLAMARSLDVDGATGDI